MRKLSILLLLILLFMLFLTACSSQVVGKEGPITVILDTPQETTRVCQELLGNAGPKQYWRGCVTIGGGQAIVRCPFDDAQCLAHEFRHVVEPGFHQ